MRDITTAHLTRSASFSPATANSYGRACRVGQRLSRLSDDALLRRLARLVARDRATTAALLAHIAEVDARRLYAPAGYPSMYAYCVGALRLSEDAASRRIQAARAARRVPALFKALAGGRLHLTAVCLLAPHLTGENADELIEAAAHRGKAEIETMLFRRLLGRSEYALAHVDVGGATAGDGETREGPDHPGDASIDNRQVDEHALAHVADLLVEPATPSLERVSLYLAISRSTQEKLRYAQALLSHAVPSGDPAEVLDRALDALIEKVEKRRFGAGGARLRPAGAGGARRTSTKTSPVGVASGRERAAARQRYIPTHVRRAVWERDRGRCTFVGTNGHRCEERHFLEFDHVEPVARGGTATVQGLRLRCRTHNQYEAERVLGAGFMENKRREARKARQDLALAGERAESTQDAGQIQDILAGLKSLGCRAAEARRAACVAAALPGATLEERLRASLQTLGRRTACATIPAIRTEAETSRSRNDAPMSATTTSPSPQPMRLP